MRKAKVPPGIPEPVLQGSERSALFWLLYQHHDALLDRWSGRRVDWNLVSAWAETQQAWDRNGQKPRPNTARRTWERVRALVAREKAQRQARQRPAQVPTPAVNHTPTVAKAPPMANPPNRLHPAPAQGMASAEARVAELNAIIDRRSGRS